MKYCIVDSAATFNIDRIMRYDVAALSEVFLDEMTSSRRDVMAMT